MFCLLSFNKQNIKGSLLIVDNLIIKKTPKNMFLSGLNYQTDIYTILVNRFYLDTNLSNEYKALNVKEIRVVDVLGEVINGVFKGQWMRVLDDGGNTLYIPSFFLSIKATSSLELEVACACVYVYVYVWRLFLIFIKNQAI